MDLEYNMMKMEKLVMKDCLDMTNTMDGVRQRTIKDSFDPAFMMDLVL